MGRGLFRRIAQFRYLGYALLALGFAAADEFEGRGYAIWLLVLGIAWPACLHACAKLSAGNGNGLRVLQAFENLAGSLCAALFQFPVVQFMALLVSLVSGNIAQGGLKRMPEALLAAGVGWLVGDWGRVMLGMDPYFEATGLSDLIGYTHLLLFTSLISAAGYERSVQMHRARSQLAQESTRLRAFSGRVAKYVDPGLAQRLLEHTEQHLPHRRVWISACFVDLVEFTRMTSRFPAEAVCETLNLFLGRVSALAKSQGGRMDKFLGDGVLITFGDLADLAGRECAGRCPTRNEIATALLCFAGRLPSLMDEINRDLDQRALPIELQVRMGGASGYCTVGDFGEGERLDYTVIGPAINLASRLEALAPAGTLLMDEATHKLADHKMHRSHWDTRPVKGFSEALSLWLVS